MDDNWLMLALGIFGLLCFVPMAIAEIASAYRKVQSVVLLEEKCFFFVVIVLFTAVNLVFLGIAVQAVYNLSNPAETVKAELLQ